MVRLEATKQMQNFLELEKGAKLKDFSYNLIEDCSKLEEKNRLKLETCENDGAENVLPPDKGIRNILYKFN